MLLHHEGGHQHSDVTSLHQEDRWQLLPHFGSLLADSGFKLLDCFNVRQNLESKTQCKRTARHEMHRVFEQFHASNFYVDWHF